MIQRWNGDIGELVLDNSGEKPVIHENMEGPSILQSEIRSASVKRNRNRNKAAG